MARRFDLEKTHVNPLMRPMVSALLAATAVFFFDPARGRRRRALLRDRTVSMFAVGCRSVDVGARDLVHRMRGTVTRASRLLVSDHPDDEVLRERVRAAMGRVISHPGAIDVAAKQGHVTLTGDVLRHEHKALIECVSAVRGVHGVEDRVYAHKTADHISALQGGRPRSTNTRAQQNWTPAACLVAGVGGSLLMLWGAQRRTGAGFAVAGAGGALLVRSVQAQVQTRARITDRRAIDIQKSLHIEAPVEQVFDTLARYENFPQFMRHVKSVTTLENGRSHWVVTGPAGTSIEWESVTTAYVPNEVLAWRSARNASIGHSGIMRLRPEGSGTRLHINMTYHPPAGALGHLVARLFGVDAKTDLDEDLLRLKTFLETGVPPRDAAARKPPAAEIVHSAEQPAQPAM